MISPRWRPAHVAALTLAVLAPACRGGRHVRGESQGVASASYDEPHTGTSLFGYEGEGDAPNGGVALAYQRFVMDRWALGVRLGGRYYDQSGGAVVAAELEGVARHYLFELGALGVGFEASGGRSLAGSAIPPGGTADNWIFGLGPTFELPLTDALDLLFGLQWRHLSNGQESASNPTQNDTRVWIGLAFDL